MRSGNISTDVHQSGKFAPEFSHKANLDNGIVSLKAARETIVHLLHDTPRRIYHDRVVFFP